MIKSFSAAVFYPSKLKERRSVICLLVSRQLTGLLSSKHQFLAAIQAIDFSNERGIRIE